MDLVRDLREALEKYRCLQQECDNTSQSIQGLFEQIKEGSREVKALLEKKDELATRQDEIFRDFNIRSAASPRCVISESS